MAEIYDRDGNLAGHYPLTDRDLSCLARGHRLSISFNIMPRFSHPALGDAGEVGAFDVVEDDGVLYTTRPSELKRYKEAVEARNRLHG